MHGLTYMIIWVVLTFFPLITAWKKRWWACALFSAGWIFFLYTVLQNKGGWDDLADLAMLIVVVAPVYLIASIVWLLGSGKKLSR
ncbi:hypothetical protein GE107_18500 [Cohnella sp. CFH 77786]|uniref:hypothetical protein n=1 Tax=Cohnella sp. CFH 77786 TaxID=2662265 RepID=UPI001C60F5C0|nr:hypothetical protein [Cohnella sp. CFH 77786]MBW5448051.1 hypothetical protein [Cohnella sp. CFH 77786]